MFYTQYGNICTFVNNGEQWKLCVQMRLFDNEREKLNKIHLHYISSQQCLNRQRLFCLLKYFMLYEGKKLLNGIYITITLRIPTLSIIIIIYFYIYFFVQNISFKAVLVKIFAIF